MNFKNIFLTLAGSTVLLTSAARADLADFPELTTITLKDFSGDAYTKLARRKAYCKIASQNLIALSSEIVSAAEVAEVLNDPAVKTLLASLGGETREIALYKATSNGAVIRQKGSNGLEALPVPRVQTSKVYSHNFDLGYFKGPAFLRTVYVTGNADGFTIRGNFAVPESAAVMDEVAFKIDCE